MEFQVICQILFTLASYCGYLLGEEEGAESTAPPDRTRDLSANRLTHILQHIVTRITARARSRHSTFQVFITTKLPNYHRSLGDYITGYSRKRRDSGNIEFSKCPMLTPVHLLPSAIADLFAEVSSTGRITLADRYGLMAALLEDALEQEDMFSINRLLRAVSRGRLQVVDELSALI